MLALLAFSGYRAWLTHRSLGESLDCSSCLFRPVLAQDLWLVALFVSAFVVARLVGARMLSIGLGIAMASVAFLFALDILILHLLSRRLLAEDVFRYGPDLAADVSIVSSALGGPANWLLAGMALVFVLAVAAAISRASNRPRRKAIGFWALVVSISLLLALAQGKTWYLNRHGFENVLVLNAPDGRTRPYGADTLRRLAETPPPPLVCEAGSSQAASVVVLVVESLSLHHSFLFSGFADSLTPNIDALAGEGSWFPSFYANGFSTEGGLIALLTGDAPISGIRYGTAMLFTKVHQDFHRDVRRRGYATRFFTTGTLKFGRRDEWLDAIGIESAEGDEHPAYAGLPRGAFNASDDQSLFRRFLDWYDEERPPSPFIATLLTVGMHPPFVALDGGARGEAAAVLRMDEAVGSFVGGLRARGFFKRNVLFIVGDHRVMSPLRPDELTRIGPRALVRVPALVLGASGLPTGPVHGDFQQADLLPSLQYLTGAESCRTAFQGRMFGPEPQPARAHLFADPMRYDQVLARVSGRDFLLRLDGENTRWIGDAPGPGFDVALEVARLRLDRERRPPD